LDDVLPPHLPAVPAQRSTQNVLLQGCNEGVEQLRLVALDELLPHGADVCLGLPVVGESKAFGDELVDNIAHLFRCIFDSPCEIGFVRGGLYGLLELGNCVFRRYLGSLGGSFPQRFYDVEAADRGGLVFLETALCFGILGD
jgi:hypothetical protein